MQSEYSCEEIRKDIDFCFSREPGKDFNKEQEALRRVFAHIRVKFKKIRRKIACQECWDYYNTKKSIMEGKVKKKNQSRF